MEVGRTHPFGKWTKAKYKVWIIQLVGGRYRGKDREYCIDLDVGEVTWVWFTRTGMCAISGRGRGWVEE